MLLKTNKVISETNSNELKLGAHMREMDAKSELFDSAHFPAGYRHGGMRRGSKLSEGGNPGRIAKNYKNSGNELKKYFETKDFTF